MDAGPWCWATAREVAAAVRAGVVRAVDVTRSQLERIARLDGRLGSFLHVDAEGALAAAAAVDQAVASGRDPGRLAGVPVALKDLLVTRGVPTTAGSRILAGWRPPFDGTAVVRLRAEGAIILGKLNLDEFGMGSSNEASAFHPCRNPWDLDRVPGGSSGGSAAAVAAGLCAIALGSDTGGSIRQPAAFCGCVGLKPTYGRVSRHGLVAFASSLDQVGPLARSTADCALALEVIAGFDPLDATSLDLPIGAMQDACTEPLVGLRIGVPEAFFGAGLSPAVATCVAQAVDRLVALGAEVVSVSLPHAATDALAAYYLIAPAEASSNLARYDGVRYGLRVDGADLADTYSRTRAAGFGWEVKRRVLLGTFALRAGYRDAYYDRAQRVRRLIADEFAAAFTTCDVIATPTSPTVAFALGDRRDDPMAMYLADVYTIACNLAGLPGLSLPCGFIDEMPVGLQLLAPPLGEAAILRAAAHYERATDWHRRRPVGLGEAAA